MMISPDRISPITSLLDEVLYKSSIKDMRSFYFSNTRKVESWLLFSDYYLDNKKPNNVISFTALPYVVDLMELQKAIKQVAPKDIKHTRNINPHFVELINSLPIINIQFIFEQKRYFIWDSGDDVRLSMLEYIQILAIYVDYWRSSEPGRSARLNKISKNLRCLENLLKSGKKLKLIAAMFLISLLGGYVGSLLCRETSLSSLVWFADRDSTNEICHNLIRDLFEITLIDITKKNIQFSFTTANSNSDEWYSEMTRIPDYLTGAVSSFDFNQNLVADEKSAQMLGFHFQFNIRNTFLYKFKFDDEGMRIQRMLVT